MTNLDKQFNELSKKASCLLCLVPSSISSDEYKRDKLDEAIKLYNDDLPSPSSINNEICLWQNICKETYPKPDTALDALKMCNKLVTPNVFALLKITCTLPITSNTCERSGSALRHLHTFCRVSMAEERLSALALMYIHKNKEIDVLEVIKVFARQKHRRLELE